jgi:protein-S-isoprenylcysteine O-methyltransferase Ste14
VTEPLVFSHGAAAGVFGGVSLAWLVFEAAMNIRQRLRVGGGLTLRDPTALVLIACLGASVVAAELLGRDGGVLWPGGRLWPVIAGIALIVAGVGLRAWSIATLGRFFQYQIEIQAGHQVVTTGPYRYVRHPSYTGIALVLAGFALASGDVLSLVAVAVLGGLGLAVRIRAEERQLTEALGADYERFAAQRKRLIPGVW